MLCMNILHNRHTQLFRVHSLVYFLNSSRYLIFLISGVKSTHIFRPKEGVVSDLQRTVLASLQWSVGQFLGLYGTVLKKNILLIFLGAKLFLALNDSFASVCKLR